MAAITETTPTYGYTDAGESAHIVINPAHRLSACGRYLAYIPLTQPATPTVCRLCIKFADPAAVAAVAPATPIEVVEERTGSCAECGGETPLDGDGLVIPHGVARMRGGRIVHTPEPCPGAGSPPEGLL